MITNIMSFVTKRVNEWNGKWSYNYTADLAKLISFGKSFANVISRIDMSPWVAVEYIIVMPSLHIGIV